MHLPFNTRNNIIVIIYNTRTRIYNITRNACNYGRGGTGSLRVGLTGGGRDDTPPPTNKEKSGRRSSINKINKIQTQE